MPLGFFRRRTPTGANIVGFGLGTVVFSMFFLLSLYQQEVLGFSALETGVGYLAVALTAVVASGAAQALVTRLGVKPVLAFGLLMILGGLIWFTQISVDGSYVADLLGGFLMIGVGLGFSFVPVSIAALAGVPPREAGLASGLINTSQQIGGALGVAILTTVSTTTTSDELASGTPEAEALVDGFSVAFWVAAAFAAAAVVATLLTLRREDLAAAPSEAPVSM
jgi:MFS family permease